MAPIRVQIVGDESLLLRSLRRSETAIDRFANKVRGSAKGLHPFESLKGNLVGLATGLVGFTGAVEAIKGMVGAASDLETQINRTRSVFGQSGSAIVDWSKTSANAIGLSQQKALAATDTFGGMLTSMGVGKVQAAGMSESLVKLAADMAEFKGANPDDVLRALQAGLAGSSRALKQYGVDLSATKLKAEEAALGFTKGAEAAKAAKEAYQSAGTAVTAAHKAQTAATTELHKAQSGLTKANNDLQTSTDGLATAQNTLASATQTLSAARDRETTAAEGVKTAEQTLKTAQNASKDAQVALTQARRDAVQQLRDLKDANIDSALSEQRAQLSVAQARQHLHDVMKDSTSTELDRRDAILGVKEAEQAATEATQHRKDAAAKARDAERRGVGHDQGVIDARNGVADAHDNVQKAQQGVADAGRAFAQAQNAVVQAVTKVAQAQQGLADAQAKQQAATAAQATAQARLATAQDNNRTATERLKTAQDKLNTAKKKFDDLNKSGAGKITDQQKALAAYKLIMEQTANQQGTFSRNQGSLSAQTKILQASLENLNAKLGKVLTPTILDIIKKLSNWFSHTENQRKVTDLLKGTVTVLHTALVILRGAFRLLSGAVGGNRNAIGLLVAMYATFKAVSIAKKFKTVLDAVGGLTKILRGKGGAVDAAEQAAGALGGKGGLAKTAEQTGEEVAGKGGLIASVGGLTSAFGLAAAGAAALAGGYALGSLIYQIPIVKQLADEAADSIASLFGYTNPLDQYKGKVAPTQSIAASIRSQAAAMEARGVTAAQAAGALELKYPNVAKRDIETYAGVHSRLGYATAPIIINGQMNFHGIQNVPQFMDAVAKHARSQPQRRRG